MAAIDDEGFDLLPPGIEPLDAEAELELEDELEEQPLPAGAEFEAPAPPPLGRTPAYDFVDRSLVPHEGAPRMLYGLATLSQWVEKCLRTRQGENAACDPSFGVAILPTDLLDGGPLDESAMAEAIADWTRALLVHPRVSSVEDWDVQTTVDAEVLVACRVVGEGIGDDDGFPLDLTIGA